MAWQLIYTSAPRSLEAGRSGFGTVARHRALSPLLVSAIERTSQFSRLPGVDTDRVIFSHRVVTVAGSRFHVLSSIRDAGADYTGRTNHIAHHLIVDPREIAQLGAGGPSPADVLLAMTWATSWTEHPRYLEAADEVALATLHARTTGTAWQRITGDPNQAGLLATGDASRGAYIIQPPGVDDLREVFAESLRLMPERLWQISFTTSLQPSDESADFRWIGIEERSPLRAQSESSGRPVLNLASPGTLPIVQVAHPAEVLSVAPLIPSPASEMDVSPSAALHMNEVGKSPVAPPKLRISVRPSMPSHASNEKLVKNTSAGYTSVTKKNTARPLPWLWIAAMAVVFILAGIWHLIVAPYLQAQREEKSERERIVKFVNDAVHFTRPAVNGDKDQDFSKVPLPDLRRLNKLAELTREMISFMKPPEFEKMREAEQAFANESKEAPRSSLPVPPEFDAIRKSLVESISINEELKRIHTSKEGDSAFTDLKTVTKRIEDLDGGSSPHRSALQAKLREIAAAESERVADKEASPLLALLKGNNKPPQALEWYKKEVEAADKRAPALKERLKPVHTFLEDWKFVEDQKLNEAPENLAKRLKERPDWPDWLKGQAKNKIISARTGNAPQPEKLVSPPAPATSKISSPPNAKPDSPRPVFYFFKENTDLSYPLPAGGEPVELMLRMAGQKEVEARPYGTGDSFGSDGFYFKKQGGNLISGTKPPDPPYRLAIKRGAAEIARIFVGQPSKEDCLENISIELDLKPEGQIHGTLPKLDPLGGVGFNLGNSSFIDGNGKPCRLEVTADGKCELKTVIGSIRTRIKQKNEEAENYAKKARDLTKNTPAIDAQKVGNLAVDTANQLEPPDPKRKVHLLQGLREAGTSLSKAPEADKIKANYALRACVEGLMNGLYKSDKYRSEREALGKLKGDCFTLKTQMDTSKQTSELVKEYDLKAKAADRAAAELGRLPLLQNKLPPGDYTLFVNPSVIGLDPIKLRTLSIP